MSWVNDLASVLGIPGGAAVLAGAMYSACVAAEKAARPEALKDIGRILKDTSWGRSVRPSALIERVFVWTFGERQFSWRCVRCSLIGTAVSSIVFGLVYSAFSPFDPMLFSGHVSTRTSEMADAGATLRFAWKLPLCFAVVLLVGGILPDYLSIAKSRSLIRLIARPDRSVVAVFMLMTVDIFVSITISPIAYSIFISTMGFAPFLRPEANASGEALSLLTTGSPFLMLTLYSSTLLTSIWTVLTLLSTAVLKMLAPIQSLSTYFFDLDKHPLKAVGIVSGTLVMVGAGFWAALAWTMSHLF